VHPRSSRSWIGARLALVLLLACALAPPLAAQYTPLTSADAFARCKSAGIAEGNLLVNRTTNEMSDGGEMIVRMGGKAVASVGPVVSDDTLTLGDTSRPAVASVGVTITPSAPPVIWSRDVQFTLIRCSEKSARDVTQLSTTRWSTTPMAAFFIGYTTGRAAIRQSHMIHTIVRACYPAPRRAPTLTRYCPPPAEAPPMRGDTTRVVAR
jgi:hypothetical protein